MCTLYKGDEKQVNIQSVHNKDLEKPVENRYLVVQCCLSGFNTGGWEDEAGMAMLPRITSH